MIGNANMPGNATTVLAAHNTGIMKLFPAKHCFIIFSEDNYEVPHADSITASELAGPSGTVGRILWAPKEARNSYDYAAIYSRGYMLKPLLEFRKVVGDSITVKLLDRDRYITPAKALSSRSGYEDYDFYQIDIDGAGTAVYKVNKHTGESTLVSGTSMEDMTVAHDSDPDVDKPTDSKTTTEVKTETIPAKTFYEAANDWNMTFGEKKPVHSAEDGKKEVTYQTTTTADGKSETKVIATKEITPAKDGLTKVGNLKVMDSFSSSISTLMQVYDVDKDTGKLSDSPSNQAKLKCVIGEFISPKTTYEADSNLAFGETKEVSPAVAGERERVYLSDIHDLKSHLMNNHKLGNGDTTKLISDKVTKAAKNGVIKVGNKNVQTIVDEKGQKTIIATTYNVDPKTGELDLQHFNEIRTTRVETEAIPAVMTYADNVADLGVEFGKKKDRNSISKW